MKNNARTTMFMLLIILIAANLIMYPKLWVVHVFALVFTILNYKFFGKTSAKFLLYSTLLYALIDSSLSFSIGSRYKLLFSMITILLYYIISVPKIFSDIRNLNAKKIVKNKYMLFFLIFVVYVLIGIIFTKSKKLAISMSITYAYMFLILLAIVFENKDIKDIKNTFNFLISVSMGILALGTMEIFGIRYGVQTIYDRIHINVLNSEYFRKIPIVFFYNQNNYAVFLIILMSMLLIYSMYMNNKYHRILAYFVFAVCQVNLILTTSRICWVSEILMFGFAFFNACLMKSRKAKLHVGKYIAICACVYAIFYFIPTTNIYYGKFANTTILKSVRDMTMINNDKKDKSGDTMEIGGAGSDNERYTLILDIASGVVIHKHLLGFGIGNTMYYIKTLKNTHSIVNPHSMWFEILGDYGVFIFIYFAYIYGSMIKTLNSGIPDKENKKYPLMASTACFVFIITSFAPSTVTGFSPFWILMGLSLSLVFIVNNYNKKIVK